MNNVGIRTENVAQQVIRERGDVFPEVALIGEVAPETLTRMQRCAGYVHGYVNHTGGDQVLSDPIRELIAITQLCGMRDLRFAPNHVRRLYRFGIADDVIIEAAEAIAPATGHATIVQVARAIEKANKKSYPHGAMPEGGRPTESIRFREMDAYDVPDDVVQGDMWPQLASIDPELTVRFREFLDHCLGSTDGRKPLLNPAVRGLIVIPALSVRGAKTLVREHTARLLGYGVTTREIVEAVSCVLPMTGAATMDSFLDAIAGLEGWE